MLLAYFERDFPNELRADFQEHYGLNIDRMGDDYTFFHAAVLAAQLPDGSRTMRALFPERQWDDQTRILAMIEHGIRILAWQQTKDGRNGRRFPQPIKSPAQQMQEKKRLDGFDPEFVRKVLGEVTDG